MRRILLPPKRNVAKPALWAPSSALVSPEWHPLWERPPALYMPMWEGAGSPRDLGPHRHVASPSTSGAGWSVRKHGAALDIRSSAHFWRVPNHPSLSPTGDFTVEVFAVPTAVGANRAAVSKGRETSTGTAANRAYELGTSSGGGWRAVLSSGSGFAVLNGSIPAVAGEPTHVVTTRIGSDWRLYVDGQLDVSDSESLAINVHDGPLIFGRHVATSTSEEFQGYVLLVSVRAYGLTDAEARRLTGGDPFAPVRPRVPTYFVVGEIDPGDPDPEGGSETTVSITAEGAGTKLADSGSETGLAIGTTGAGTKAAEGGASAAVQASAEGAGTKLAQAGSEASLAVSATGAGTKTAQGGSEATLSITATGGGTSEDPPVQGGSETTVNVASTGAGTKLASGGSEAAVGLSTESAGIKHAFQGSEGTLLIVSEGAGTKTASQGSETAVLILTTGGGVVGEVVAVSGPVLGTSALQPTVRGTQTLQPTVRGTATIRPGD